MGNDQEVMLMETEGKVHNVAEFVEMHHVLLSPHEQRLLASGAHLLHLTIPSGLDHPLSKVARENSKENGLPAQNSGVRSTYDTINKRKFKACISPDEPLPYWNLCCFFGESQFRIVEDSYGVLDTKEAMREIAAINYLQQLGLPNVLDPLCIFEYTKNGESRGFCIVEASEYNHRLDQMDLNPVYYAQTCLRLALMNQELFRKVVPLEKAWLGPEIIKATIAKNAGKAGVSIDEYIERERGILQQQIDKPFWYGQDFVDEIIAKQIPLLINMHFKGLFRNMANGHIGNTIISPARDYFPCDFETAHMISIPKNPDVDFMKDFYLASVLEAIESDIGPLSFVPIPNLSTSYKNKRKVFERVFGRYQEVSNYFNEFTALFLEKCGDHGWDISLMQKAMMGAQESRVFFDQVMRHMPNDFGLAYYPFSRGMKNPYLIRPAHGFALPKGAMQPL